MTFVTLPSFADFLAGASAWSYPLMQEFIPAMFWPIACFGAAMLLVWMFTHLINIGDWLKNSIAGQPKRTASGQTQLERKMQILEDYGFGQDIIQMDNNARAKQRLARLLEPHK